ncbi:hypothetical protein F1559_001341 [Cyanidiococcus yangmingshanensis]|uniref:G-patch domain-containing protein n=1 Tax=Cyanidiococcus yangmingshanensis TaxID=2690220 RepID=A0A7J7IJI1_9RHOD|nr:hypothetical protein F1559_001341 [Cyanidiococcus yangmingshanensis]
MRRRCGHVFVFDEDADETLCCLCGTAWVDRLKEENTSCEHPEAPTATTRVAAGDETRKGSDAGQNQQLPGALNALQLEDSEFDTDSDGSLVWERKHETAAENEFVFEAFERFRSHNGKAGPDKLAKDTVSSDSTANKPDLDEVFSNLERKIRHDSRASGAYRGLKARLAHLEREADFNQTLLGRERRRRAPKRSNLEAVRERVEAEMRQALAAMYAFCQVPLDDAPEYEIMPPMGNTSRKLVHQLAAACRAHSQSGGNPRCTTIFRNSQTRWCGEERALRLLGECLEEAMLKRTGRYRTPRTHRKDRSRGRDMSSATEQRAVEQGTRHHRRAVRGTVRTERGRAQLQQTTLMVQPVESANRGHEMLRRIGWQPGQALGTENARERALLEPVAATVRAPRRGLGASTPPPPPPPPVSRADDRKR